LWALAEKWINLERFAEQFEYGRVKHAQTQNAWQAGFDGAGLSDCDAEPVQLAG
jgi:phage terminase large subunit-like protein